LDNIWSFCDSQAPGKDSDKLGKPTFFLLSLELGHPLLLLQKENKDTKKEGPAIIDVLAKEMTGTGQGQEQDRDRDRTGRTDHSMPN
jgi:hypothetical protein